MYATEVRSYIKQKDRRLTVFFNMSNQDGKTTIYVQASMNNNLFHKRMYGIQEKVFLKISV